MTLFSKSARGQKAPHFYRVVESNGFCIVYQDGNEVQRFVAVNNLPEALKTLQEINALQCHNGMPIYQQYCSEGIYFWSLIQESLFYDVLVPYIKYKEIIHWWRVNVGFETPTGLAPCDHCISIITASHLTRNQTVLQTARELLETLALFVNAVAVNVYRRISGARFLLWSLNSFWGRDWLDYRLKDVYSELWSRHIAFIETFPFPGFAAALRRLLRSRRLCLFVPNIGYIQPSAYKHLIHITYAGEVTGIPREHLTRILQYFELKIANAQRQSRLFTKFLSITGLKQVYAIDEHTSFAPLVYACRKLTMNLVGMQHGVFHKYSVGWTCPGIPRQFTAGYDKILVWGEYWQALLARLSTVYRPDELLPTGYIRPSAFNLAPRQHQPLKSSEFRILVFYEFLANPDETFQYIETFHKKGYRIFFKIRFDDPVKSQLGSIPRDWVHPVHDLTQDFLDTINVCAGTMTSMMYELYVLGVPVWFLSMRNDNNVRMVEDGLAHLITLDMLSDSAFNPYSRLLNPTKQGSIAAAEGIPCAVSRLAAVHA